MARRGWSWVVGVGAGLMAPGVAAEVGYREGPIVDGRRGGAGDLRATVALTDTSGESFCTGTLIAPRVVVTAAHCIVNENEETGQVLGVRSANELQVVAGATDVGSAPESMRYGVSEVIAHEGYPNDGPTTDPSGAGRFDDVGVLLLAQPVGGLTPAYIPSVDEAMARLSAGVAVTITGYGATSPTTDDSGVLYTAETPFQTRVDAEIVLGSNGDPDTCPGDSGGPAYLVVGGASWLVGVTSRAGQNSVAACGEGGIYGFAPVYRDWFASHSQGLYVAGTGPTPTDPTPTDPTPTDPTDDCDPEVDEDCFFDDEDEGCAGGGIGLWGLAGLGVVWAGRRLRARAARV